MAVEIAVLGRCKNLFPMKGKAMQTHGVSKSTVHRNLGRFVKAVNRCEALDHERAYNVHDLQSCATEFHELGDHGVVSILCRCY